MALEITGIICGSFVFIVLAVLVTAVTLALKRPAPVPPTLDEMFSAAEDWINGKAAK